MSLLITFKKRKFVSGGEYVKVQVLAAG